MPAKTRIAVAENARFRVEVDPRKRVLTLTDTATDTRWCSANPFVRIRIPKAPDRESPDWYWGLPDPSEEVPWTPQRLRVEANGPRLVLRMRGLALGRASLDLLLNIVLMPDRIRFEVEELRGLPRGAEVIVDFPYRLGGARAGRRAALVLPRGAGILADFSRARTGYSIENLIYSGGQNGYSMPIYGIVRAGAILGAIIKTPFDCLLRAELNSGDPAFYAASPCWLFEGGRLTYPRRVDYTVFAGSYGELAKWYRADLVAERRYRSLEEKAEGHPLVRRLPGAVLAEMHLKFSDKGKPGRSPYELADKAKSMGFPGLVAYSVGIWQRPFHGTHAVPPDEGTEEDLGRAARYARSVNENYWITVYENLIDMWPTTPGYDEKTMAKLRDGSARPNWYSDALKSRSSTVCSVCRLETAQRDLPHLKHLIGPGSIYVDVEGAMEINECFDAIHPLTREEDAGYRRRILSYTRDLFGTVATESMPMDCLADSVDVGAYFPIYQFIGYGCSSKPRIEPPVVPIPLFPLVYHGSVLSMNPRDHGFYTADPPYLALWGMMADDVDEFGLRISRELGQTSFATMVDHQFLTGPDMEVGTEIHTTDVQMSRFSDGVAVIANFSDEPFRWEGKTVGRKDFVVWKD